MNTFARYVIPVLRPFPIWRQCPLNDEHTEFKWYADKFASKEITSEKAKRLQDASLMATHVIDPDTGKERIPNRQSPLGKRPDFP